MPAVCIFVSVIFRLASVAFFHHFIASCQIPCLLSLLFSSFVPAVCCKSIASKVDLFNIQLTLRETDMKTNEKYTNDYTQHDFSFSISLKLARRQMYGEENIFWFKLKLLLFNCVSFFAVIYTFIFFKILRIVFVHCSSFLFGFRYIFGQFFLRTSLHFGRDVYDTTHYCTRK